MTKAENYQVVLDLFRVVRRPAFDGGTDPHRPAAGVDDDVRVLAEVDVAAMIALLADHLKRHKLPFKTGTRGPAETKNMK